MSYEEVANAFVPHYYQTFDSNIEALSSLFVSKNQANSPPCLFPHCYVSKIVREV